MYKVISFCLGLFLFAQSETVEITECDDISLVKSAYANNKSALVYQDASKDTLILNSWRC